MRQKSKSMAKQIIGILQFQKKIFSRLIVNCSKFPVLCREVKGYSMNIKDQEYCSTWHSCECSKKKQEKKSVGQANLIIEEKPQ